MATLGAQSDVNDFLVFTVLILQEKLSSLSDQLLSFIFVAFNYELCFFFVVLVSWKVSTTRDVMW